MRFTIYFFIACASTTLYPLSYDTAIRTAQNGNTSAAYEQLCKLVVDAPDKPDLLYDAGILAHQLDKSAEAAAYFARAAGCCATDDKNLRFNAHFNAGNACVTTKKLESALDQYEKALALDPDNEYAKHNRDRVKEMLQQQNQQKNDQQEQDDKNKEDKENNQNDDQPNQDQQQNQDDSKDQQDKQQNGNEKNSEQQKQGSNQQQKKNGSSDKQSDEQSERKHGDDAQDDGNGTQGKEQRNKQQKKSDAKDDKKGNGKQELDKKSRGDKQKQDEQGGKQHDKSPEKQDGSGAQNNRASADAQEKGNEQKGVPGLENKIDDPWLQTVLDDQEQRDKAINKKLMGAKIQQHGGKNEQNSW